MDSKLYYVVNDNEDISDYDLTFKEAQEVLKKM